MWGAAPRGLATVYTMAPRNDLRAEAEATMDAENVSVDGLFATSGSSQDLDTTEEDGTSRMCHSHL